MKQTILANLLPQDCFVCGSQNAQGSSQKSLLCSACEATLPRLSSPLHPYSCPVCALPTSTFIPIGSSCGSCLKEPPHYDSTLALFSYEFPIEHLIQALKYQHRLPLAHLFAEQFIQALAQRRGKEEQKEKELNDLSIDYFIPLPLHRLRLKERGFNQAVEIARELTRIYKIPLLADVCTRELNTAPQASLPWKERRKNVRGAFHCSVDLTGKSVAVIDDVMTTGATLDEFARTLKKHGATKVCNWVVARTLKT